MTVANRKPLFVGQPKVTETDMPATANTNRDGTGTITSIYTASSPTSANGYLAEVIKFIGKGTTTTGLINVFYKPSGGGSWFLIGQVSVTGTTPSATVLAAEVYYTGMDMPLRLNSGDQLGAAPTQANAYTAMVQGGPLDNLDTAPVAQ